MKLTFSTNAFYIGNEFGSSGVEKLKEFFDKHSLSEQFGSLR